MEKRCVVKIAVSSETDYYHIDDVVYYRSGMSPDFIERWLWFFEYLAACIKVANPRRKVEFYKGPQTIKLGREWHEYRRGVMMKSRTTKLKQLEKGVVDDDLFHFKSEDNERKKAEVKAQLESLNVTSSPSQSSQNTLTKSKSMCRMEEIWRPVAGFMRETSLRYKVNGRE